MCSRGDRKASVVRSAHKTSVNRSGIRPSAGRGEWLSDRQ